MIKVLFRGRNAQTTFLIFLSILLNAGSSVNFADIRTDGCVDANIATIYAKSLDDFLEAGAKKYLQDGKLLVELERLEFGGGEKKAMAGVSRAYIGRIERREFFIFEFPLRGGVFNKQNSNRIENAVRVGKSLKELKFGPDVDVVLYNEHYFLMYDRVPGVNIKELTLKPDWITASTLDTLNSLMGTNETDVTTAVVNFTRRLLANPIAIERMYHIAAELDRRGFSDPDLQFMVSDWSNVIDTDLYKRANGGTFFGHTTFVKQLDDYLQTMREISSGSLN